MVTDRIFHADLGQPIRLEKDTRTQSRCKRHHFQVRSETADQVLEALAQRVGAALLGVPLTPSATIDPGPTSLKQRDGIGVAVPEIGIADF